MLTSFSLFSSPFLFSFSSFTYLYHIYFLSLRVWDPELTNPKLGDRPQLWSILRLVTIKYFRKKGQ